MLLGYPYTNLMEKLMTADTSYSWTIDKDAKPGIFISVVSATSEQYSLRMVDSTTFEVI